MPKFLVTGTITLEAEIVIETTNEEVAKFMAENSDYEDLSVLQDSNLVVKNVVQIR